MAAFPPEENQQVADLVVELLPYRSKPPVFSFLAEDGGKASGFVIFSPLTIPTDPDISAYILAPLAVSPEQQGKSIGRKLIETGQNFLRDQGVNALLVYGDPAYYGRFGFDEATARPFAPPYPLQYPFGWQGMVLSGGDKALEETPFECVAPLNRPDLW